MTSTTCLSCAFEEKSEIKIDDSMTNTAWAKEIGVSEASIRRHKAHSPILAQSSGFIDLDGADALAASIDVPDSFVTSRGMSLRDPLTGSWQKISWMPNKKALHDTLRYDDLRDSMDGWVFEDRVNPFVQSGAAIFCMSDLQIGKAGQRMGGTPETLERIRKSIATFRTELEARSYSPKTIVIWDGGDPVENVFNTPEQIATNDLSLPEQIRVARRIFLEAIKALAPYAEELVFVTVPSNHGRMRVGYKAAGGTVDADFGLEISHQLEDIVNENEFLARRVSFVRPDPLFETAELTVARTKLAFTHGHNSSGQKGHSRWWADQAHGRFPGWDADILLTAHFHNLGLTQSGNGRWIIETSSSDAGSDWFANKSGQTAVQGITAFDVQDGMWSNLRVI